MKTFQSPRQLSPTNLNTNPSRTPADQPHAHPAQSNETPLGSREAVKFHGHPLLFTRAIAHTLPGRAHLIAITARTTIKPALLMYCGNTFGLGFVCAGLTWRRRVGGRRFFSAEVCKPAQPHQNHKPKLDEYGLVGHSRFRLNFRLLEKLIGVKGGYS